MGEVEEMKQMLAQLLQSNIEQKRENAEQKRENAEQNRLHKEENAKLIAALNARPLAQPGPGAPANAPDAAVIRREKLNKLGISLRKSAKVKDFKDAAEVKIKDWVLRYDAEVTHLKLLNGIEDDLTRDEYIECIRDKLDYNVIKRLDTFFSTINVTWLNVSIVRIKEILIQEFGTKESDVSSVLLQFGPNRVRKGDMSVQEFYHKWKDQIPTCMDPATEQARIDYVDLMNRSLFYYCLDDAHIQEELCKLKGPQDNLKGYLDCATEVEARRKSFKEIGVSSASLDQASGISVSRWEGRDRKKPFKFG